MAWVDYRKAYDLVPHTWLLTIMDLTKIAGNIDIGMEFGFEKCAMIVMKAGTKVETTGIHLPNGERIKELDNNGYKYLGVLQECGILQKDMKERIRSEYISRVKAVAKSFLYSKNLFIAINVWAVSVVRYAAGIVLSLIHISEPTRPY